MARHLHLSRVAQVAKPAPDANEIEWAVQHYLYGDRRQIELLLADRDPAVAAHPGEPASPSGPAHDHHREIGRIPG